MRQFLAAAFLGATLAFGASPALASDNVDYVPAYQRAQSNPVVSATAIRTDIRGPVVAGGRITATSVYRQLREENFGR
jgi:hypothetical protein